MVLLPMRKCPPVNGFALWPSSRAPALPAHSPCTSFTRGCTPRRPDSTISSIAFRSSGRSCPWPGAVTDMSLLRICCARLGVGPLQPASGLTQGQPEGVRVRLVRIAKDGGGTAGQEGWEDQVAEVGLGAAARPEVVGGAADRHLHAPGLVRAEQVLGHPAPESATDAARASYLLIVQVLGAIALEAAELPSPEPAPPIAERVATRREQLRAIPADGYPRTAEAADTIAQSVSDEQYAWSLDRVLDGIAARAKS